MSRFLLLVLLPAMLAAPAEVAAQAKVRKRAKPSAPRNPPVELFHVNRKETMSLRLRDDRGRAVRGVQKRFDRFLRCHYTNRQHRMNPRLLKIIYQTGRKWPGRRIEVVSGYRHPKVAKNPSSPHMKGLASDFRVVGVKNTELRDYLRATFDKVGVGYYPNSSFVHLDVRKDRSAFWIDYSAPGERAMYSEDAAEDLKSGRADQYRPTKIDLSWVDDAPPAPPDEDEGPPPPATPPAAAREELKKTPVGPVQEQPPGQLSGQVQKP